REQRALGAGEPVVEARVLLEVPAQGAREEGQRREVPVEEGLELARIGRGVRGPGVATEGDGGLVERRARLEQRGKLGRRQLPYPHERRPRRVLSNADQRERRPRPLVPRDEGQQPYEQELVEEIVLVPEDDLVQPLRRRQGAGHVVVPQLLAGP